MTVQIKWSTSQDVSHEIFDFQLFGSGFEISIDSVNITSRLSVTVRCKEKADLWRVKRYWQLEFPFQMVKILWKEIVCIVTRRNSREINNSDNSRGLYIFVTKVELSGKVFWNKRCSVPLSTAYWRSHRIWEVGKDTEFEQLCGANL